MGSLSRKGAGFLGMGAGGILFPTFLVLKLTGVVDWSWWVVTAPLWVPALIGLALFALAIVASD